MLRRRRHHDLAHARRAGEEDMIEGLVEQFLTDLDPALHHAHEIGRQRLLHDLRDHGGAGRSQLGRFDDRGTARRDGRNQRPERQRQRVIPRRDDQRGALRLGHDPRAGAQHRAGRADPADLRPRLQVAQRVRNLGLNGQDFGQPDLGLGLGEILGQRREDLRFAIVDRARERLQRRAPLRGIESHAALRIARREVDEDLRRGLETAVIHRGSFAAHLNAREGKWQAAARLSARDAAARTVRRARSRPPRSTDRQGCRTATTPRAPAAPRRSPPRSRPPPSPRARARIAAPWPPG